jgi:hypothetical protein
LQKSGFTKMGKQHGQIAQAIERRRQTDQTKQRVGRESEQIRAAGVLLPACRNGRC